MPHFVLSQMSLVAVVYFSAMRHVSSAEGMCNPDMWLISCALQMVLETKASLESGVIGAGHRFATTRLDAQRSTAGWAKEQMGGISYLFFIRKLAQRVESEWDSVKAWLSVSYS